MALLSLASVDAQVSTELPRLVVNILIDQLRTDYLETFAPLYCDEGFRRLMAGGCYFDDVQHPFAPADRASATAAIATGTPPHTNGIAGLTWLSRKTLQPVFCVDDQRYTGLETAEKTSPNYLLVATVADELKNITARRALVCSIAPERDMAVLMAGHTADAVLWMNDQTGAWSSSQFYGKMPAWAAAYNKSTPVDKTVGRATWESAYEGAYPSYLYYHALADAKAKDFKLTFSGDRRYRQFKTSALVNDEVLSLVGSCLQSMPLGTDNTPDMLCIGLYAGTFDGADVAERPAELQDTYVRLDRALASLMASIEKRYGREHVLFVVASTGYDASARTAAVTAGTFSVQKASMLLNMFLSAKYGQAQYVEATFRNQIFIDHKIVEQRQLLLTDILAECEAFLAQMEGVADVCSTRSLALAARGTGLDGVRNAWVLGRSGDIMVSIAEGWTLETAQGTTLPPTSQTYTAFPMFFLGPTIEPAHISTTVSSAAIAPTLARCLRIRAPGASREPPLRMGKR